jgi:hypothetical protein
MWEVSTERLPQLKGRRVDTIEVIDIESQVVLNTLTARDFQEYLKMEEVLGTVPMRRRGML